MKTGFTLLELIAVIIVIGILATLGLTQYTKGVEKGRTAEARATLGLIRTAQKVYNEEWGANAPNLSLLALEAPTACTVTHFYSYTTTVNTGTATRCTASGKTPNAPTGYTVTVDYADGIWGGSAGYY